MLFKIHLVNFWFGLKFGFEGEYSSKSVWSRRSRGIGKSRPYCTSQRSSTLQNSEANYILRKSSLVSPRTFLLLFVPLKLPKVFFPNSKYSPTETTSTRQRVKLYSIHQKTNVASFTELLSPFSNKFFISTFYKHNQPLIRDLYASRLSSLISYLLVSESLFFS